MKNTLSKILIMSSKENLDDYKEKYDKIMDDYKLSNLEALKMHMKRFGKALADSEKEAFAKLDEFEEVIIAEIDGRRIANFSSPHPFDFGKYGILPGYEKQANRVKKMPLTANEDVEDGIKGSKDLLLDWRITHTIMLELERLQSREDIDIILVPFSVLQALSIYLSNIYFLTSETHSYIKSSPFNKVRGIRIYDRSNKIVSAKRFCVL